MNSTSSDEICHIAEEYAVLGPIGEKREAGWSDAAIDAEVERLPGLLRGLTDPCGEVEFVEQIVIEFMAAIRQQIEPPRGTLH